MKIRRIEIIGFKSFVDKTVLNFEDGITAILGPNGCGKSNVVDAIRWGMGEQNAKNLRGQAMEDVIFGGSEDRRAHGMAEVTMTFVNHRGELNSALNAYAEIMVTRRLYRNGESEYLLNKAPCRLKDIAELFMDTGVGARAYSIIEQGKIGQILHSRPEERRVLIEEVAGVTKYKARKKAALRKIESTRQNLVRLNDVITEVQQQLDSLRRQAKKAQRFRNLRQEVKQLELTLARSSWWRLDEQREQRQTAVQQGEEALAGAEAIVAKCELQLEQLRLHQGEADAAVARTQNQVFQWANDLKQVENELALGKQQEQNQKKQFAQINDELAQLSNLDAQHIGEIEKLTSAHSELSLRLQHAEQHCKDLGAKVTEVAAVERDLSDQLAGLRAKGLALSNEKIRQQAQLDGAVKQCELLQLRKQRHKDERDSVRRKQRDISAQKGDNQQQLESAQQQRQGAVQALMMARSQSESLQKKIVELQPEVERNRQQLNRAESLIASLQELASSREGCVDGVKQILDTPDAAKLFVGVIVDGIKVAAGYEQAIAAAMGECVHALCAETPDHVNRVDALVETTQRRVYQLCPSGEVSTVQTLIPSAKALIDVVEAEGKIRHYVSSLLQGCYCVDSLDQVLTQALPVGTVLVTPDGCRLDWRGTLTKGVDGAVQQLLHNQRRLDELRRQCFDTQQHVEQLQGRLDEIQHQFSQAKEHCHRFELEGQQHSSRVAELEREAVRLDKELAHWNERDDLLNFEAEQWAEEERALEQQRELATQEIARLVLEEQDTLTLEKEIADKWQRQQQLCTEQHDRLTQLRVDIAKMKEREKAVHYDLKREHDLMQQGKERQNRQRKMLADLTQQQHDGQGQRSELEVRRQVLLEHCQQEKDLLVQLQEKAVASVQAVEECDGRIKQQRDQFRLLSERQSERQLALQEVCLERDHLQKSILERYQLDLAVEAQSDAVSKVDSDKVEARLVKLRASLSGFGEVNLMAIEEFTALEERFDFLTGQRSDLTTSIEDLQTAINQINRTSRRRFKEAFEQVNSTFKEVFPRLFVGGHAELSLTDTTDLLESGVEIVAQPPGKKLQNVGLLSGGEKALTAVALIFAIFMIKPSPFCILDEVDAPLDDANIARFNEMVQEMAVASQFVIITHNTRTMEIADNLFGVTMEKPGISSLVAVRVGDIQSK